MSISQLKHVKNLKFFREMPLKISDLIEILPDFEIIVKKVGTLQVSTPVFQIIYSVIVVSVQFVFSAYLQS